MFWTAILSAFGEVLSPSTSVRVTVFSQADNTTVQIKAMCYLYTININPYYTTEHPTVYQTH